MELSSCAGSREGDPVSQWEAGPFQEIGGAVGTRTSQGKLPAERGIAFNLQNQKTSLLKPSYRGNLGLAK